MEDYPTARDLKNIKNWTPDSPVWNDNEFHNFMYFIREHWKYADCGYWDQDGLKYIIHTAGWSGNEDIINAMKKNYMFWSLYWESSKRGGHYTFCPNR